MSYLSLHNLTIKSFHEGLLNKEFSAFEMTKSFLDWIEEKDKEIGAYLDLHKEQALSQAAAVDKAVARDDEIAPLAGVPLAVKDNILIEGTKTTAASKILEDYPASYDATVIKKLKEAKAVFLGKTNLDEFAMGSSNENSAFGLVRNPHDGQRVPGGSSGGSAAAVAAYMALAALGSDTGGSIRQPAAFCGVVGLKPTYGAVSRHGLIALASSLDQIGPITKTVEDASILFEAIAGKDEFDATSTNYHLPLTNYNLDAIRELKIGLPKEYFSFGLDRAVEQGMEEVIRKLKSLRIRFKEVNLPHTKYALSVYYIIMPAEASTNLARYDGVRYAPLGDVKLRRHANTGNKSKLLDAYFKTRGNGFGAEPRRRILLGTFVLSAGYYDAYYVKAQRVRRLIRQDFEDAFKEVDILFTPTTPTAAFKIGEKTQDPLQMYLSDIFTIPANLAGLPAISIPAESRQNIKVNQRSNQHQSALPIGFQLIGRHFREADILSLGQYYEKI